MESYGRLVIHYLFKLCYLKKDTMSLVLPFCQEFHLTEVYAHIKGIWLDNFESLLLIELLKLDDSMQKDILLEFETKYLNIDNVLSLHTSFKSSLTTSSRNSKLEAILERLIQTVDSRVRSFLPKLLNPKLLHLYLLKPPILEIKDRIECVSEIVLQSLNDHQKAAKLGFLAWNCHKIINEQDLAVLNTLDELNTAMVNTELGKLSETVLNHLANNWLNIQLSNGFANSSSIDQSSWADFISKVAAKANITVAELMGDDISQMNQIKTKTGLAVKTKSKDVVSTTLQNTIHSLTATKKSSRSSTRNQSIRNPNATLNRRLSSHTSRRTATATSSSVSSLTNLAANPKLSLSISNSNIAHNHSDGLSVNHQPHHIIQSPRTPRLSNLHTTSSIPTRIPIPNCTVSRLGITKSFMNEDKNAGSKLPKKCNFR
ncbi:hypothetical protein BKA69DRAFT_1066847 [Paraphysoderma sedebokerense]|nr:hypothetical protein BKA69DRAFT_1066847 [Paraphysoderma sedebokerense]